MGTVTIPTCIMVSDWVDTCQLYQLLLRFISSYNDTNKTY